jgi:hypothetical protein
MGSMDVWVMSALSSLILGAAWSLWRLVHERRRQS